MSIIKELEKEVKKEIMEAGYEIDRFSLTPSARPDLGDYQINEAMMLAKTYHENPRDIALKIVSKLQKNPAFTNINIAGVGFINVSCTDSFLIESMNKIKKDPQNNLDKVEEKKIIMDYGGANIAKTLHVGHLRSANIGEAIKRLARLLGLEVISDVHFGDIGRQSGMVIAEIKRRYPHLEYFNENYTGNFDDIDFVITKEELADIYPTSSQRAKENEQVMAEVVEITKELEEGNRAYQALWDKIKKVSIEDIMDIYQRLNTEFDLLEGESDAFSYLPDTLSKLENSHMLEESEGAKVIHVKTEQDESPMPPLVVIKSNGATLYATRELATLYSRQLRFSPDEVWYFADNRQALYFEQVFRAAKKTGIVGKDVRLEFCGFGTMNGKDGKPFKTRDGGLMSLRELIDMVKEETLKRTNEEIVGKENKDMTAEMVAIAALKYADFLPYRTKDYIFDPVKFTDLEGKTGPYLLYSTIRMKSLLKKARENKIVWNEVVEIKGTSDREIALTILKLPVILNKALQEKSLNDIAEYLYKLTSLYNTFYAEHKIIKEENQKLQESWLVLTELVYQVNTLLLKTLGIKVPEKM